MNPLRSVGGRLSLALLVVVAGALAVVYALVVPSLQNSLENAKLSQLRRASIALAREVPSNRYGVAWLNFPENAAASTNARVVLFDYVSPPPALVPVGDSRAVSSRDVATDRIALQAAVTLEPVSGTIERGDDRYAEVARPTPSGPILLLSAPLHDSLANVHLVQRRLLVVGAIALALALAVGYGGAWLFARRLRRLERGAERIASGRFDEPVVDRGTDEVGQLARAFERMRLRLAQLDHARREFIANASHELRTPLFSLGGFLELMRDEQLDEVTREEFLATMREQVERLTKLAAELLDLSRLDAGHLSVEREPVPLAQLARTVADEFAAVALTGEHPLEVEADEDAVALADEQRVLQIGRILVENALVHTPPGTRVRLRAATEDGTAALVVEDEGGGIAPEHAEHVFDRFYRADGGHASGSGLGLAIARELAELMGGRVRLESEAGRTTFTVLLPRAAFSRENGASAAVPPPLS
jgi:signal transduction histidine kinase